MSKNATDFLHSEGGGLFKVDEPGLAAERGKHPEPKEGDWVSVVVPPCKYARVTGVRDLSGTRCAFVTQYDPADGHEIGYTSAPIEHVLPIKGADLPQTLREIP
jgi:hypothetical protein